MAGDITTKDIENPEEQSENKKDISTVMLVDSEECLTVSSDVS